MIVKPKTRGFICITSHPDGCAAHVQEQIDYVKSKGPVEGGPKNVLVIGSSTGYGLASRIVPAFSSGANTLGLFFEKPGTEKRTGTAEVYRSVLKTTGGEYTNKNLNTDKALIEEVTIGAASQEEIDNTIKVMGGEDWELWMNALDEAGVLADGVKSVSYSYIGPELTWPIYTEGTIGMAKKDLEVVRERLNDKLAEKYNGSAFVSVNKALVTQASSAIPVVPLYISILYKEMKAQGLHEGCIEQIQRLFADRLYGEDLQLDDNKRIRIDDWEMRNDIQAAVAKSWETISNDNLADLADFEGYQEEFLKLFGFGLNGIDYDADTDPTFSPASIEA